MNVMVSQLTSPIIVYSTVYSGADQRKHQTSASLAFVRGIHRRPVNSPHKGPVTRKMFPFDDVIIIFHEMCLRTCKAWNNAICNGGFSSIPRISLALGCAGIPPAGSGNSIEPASCFCMIVWKIMLKCLTLSNFALEFIHKETYKYIYIPIISCW